MGGSRLDRIASLGESPLAATSPRPAVDSLSHSRFRRPTPMLYFLALAVCQHAPATVSQRVSLRPPNVIVVLLDDVGIDQLNVYGGTPAWGETRARTPVIDQLRASGVLFERAYSAPLCSPSRAMLLTGRHGFRTGMLNLAEETGPCPPGYVFHGVNDCCPASDPDCQLPESQAVSPLSSEGYSLPASEVTLAEALTAATYPEPVAYTCGAFGKWHLTKRMGDPCEVIDQGFDVFQGHLYNNEGGGRHHYEWRHHEARLVGGSCTATSSDVHGQWDAEVTALEARAWIDLARLAVDPRPFFAYVSFNPPHRPFQVPPQSHVSAQTWSELENAQLGMESQIEDGVRSCHVGTNQETDSWNARLVYKASLEAVDSLIGKLVFKSPDQPEILSNTIVFIVGDNGTPDQIYQSTRDTTQISPGVAPYPPNHAKPNIYELGVHVPLIVAGTGVAVGGTCNTLVSLVDMWRTITDLAHADTSALIAPSELDSRSFAPWLRRPSGPVIGGGREFVYTELASRNAMFYERASQTWSPVVPSGAVNYQRAIIGANGFKYLRRVLGPDSGCSAAPLCSPLPSEEIYRLLGGTMPGDPTETQDCCGDASALMEMLLLRQAMSQSFSGN